MTKREQMRVILNGLPIQSPPVSVRLDLWHNSAVMKGKEPEEVRGFRKEEVEDWLGFARAARYRSKPELIFSNNEKKTVIEGDTITEKWEFAEGVLTRQTHHTEEQKRQGISGHITRFPLVTREDWCLLEKHLDEINLTFDIEGFSAFDVDTGDRGLPVLIVDTCPAHRVMLRWTGYENYFFHSYDYPEMLDNFINRITELMQEKLWPVIKQTGAEIIIHGAHFSSQMTPPPIFEKYFTPYFTEFNLEMHRVGKKVFWHSDAQMELLLDHVLQAGFDGADCLATSPLIPQSLEDYLKAWQGKIICWGGLPSIIFDPSFPMNEYRRYIENVRVVSEGRNDVIIGAGDNVMPGAQWDKLLYIKEVFGLGG